MPDFGAAMAAVGWLIEDKENNCIIFPKYFRDNESPHDRHKRQNAERQARFRRAKDSVTDSVTDNVTDNVTVTPEKRREEKRREKQENTPPPPKGGAVSSYKTWTDDDFLEEVKKHNHDGILTESEVGNFVTYWCEKSATGRTKRSMERTWDTRLRMQNTVRMIYSKDRAGFTPTRQPFKTAADRIDDDIAAARAQLAAEKGNQI